MGARLGSDPRWASIGERLDPQRTGARPAAGIVKRGRRAFTHHLPSGIGRSFRQHVRYTARMKLPLRRLFFGSQDVVVDRLFQAFTARDAECARPMPSWTR